MFLGPNLLNRPATLYTPEKAEAAAAELNAGDEDGWTYTAVHDPKGAGLSLVEIRDEDGEVVGRL